MEEAGLFSIDEYVTRRRKTIADFISTRPIYDVCRELEGCGLGVDHHMWWSQLTHNWKNNNIYLSYLE
jgi:hypothetical protein